MRVFILCGLFLVSGLSQAWEKVGENAMCPDGREGYKNHAYYVGQRVTAIQLRNIKRRRSSRVANIRFSNDRIWRAEDRAAAALEGDYTPLEDFTVYFDRRKDVGYLYFDCTSLRRDKRAYMDVWVQYARGRDRRRFD